jgi:ribonuclease P protein component
VRRDGFAKAFRCKARTNIWFAVHISANQSGHPRLGLSVSKRMLPRAVHRNTVKRLIRECFRSCAHKLLARDVVVRLRRPLFSQDVSSARVSLFEMLDKMLAEK